MDQPGPGRRADGVLPTCWGQLRPVNHCAVNRHAEPRASPQGRNGTGRIRGRGDKVTVFGGAAVEGTLGQRESSCPSRRAGLVGQVEPGYELAQTVSAIRAGLAVAWPPGEGGRRHRLVHARYPQESTGLSQVAEAAGRGGLPAGAAGGGLQPGRRHRARGGYRTFLWQRPRRTLLVRTLADQLQRGDVLLGDRLYPTFWTVAQALASGVDVVMRMHAGRAVVWFGGRGHRLDNRRTWWQKPPRPDWMTPEKKDRGRSSISYMSALQSSCVLFSFSTLFIPSRYWSSSSLPPCRRTALFGAIGLPQRLHPQRSRSPHLRSFRYGG